MWLWYPKQGRSPSTHLSWIYLNFHCFILQYGLIVLDLPGVILFCLCISTCSDTATHSMVSFWYPRSLIPCLAIPWSLQSNKQRSVFYPISIDSRACLTKKINSFLRLRASQGLQSHALICTDVNMYRHIQGVRNSGLCALPQLGSGLVKHSWGFFSTHNGLYSKLSHSAACWKKPLFSSPGTYKFL